MNTADVIIIGAGAAGLMCALEAGKRGKTVLVLDKANKVGKKILMSGGGRCNFTNLDITPDKYLSHNPHFCKSALSRYTQWDFIAMVERHRIAYYEKTLGQLFCRDKAKDIVNMLLYECEQHNVLIKLKQVIDSIERKSDIFIIKTQQGSYCCQSLVIASGGLSIPSMGASPFAYQLARQFGLKVFPTRAGLVPFTLHDADKQQFRDLSGVSVDCEVECNGQSFREMMLFTHRGLSGPVMLQISSYWTPADSLKIRLMPEVDWNDALVKAQQSTPDAQLKTCLAEHLPKRLLTVLFDEVVLASPLKQLAHQQLANICQILEYWQIKPNGTEGYRTAEVTLGGVDCDEISSKTFETKSVPGLYFIGEALDVTGWLGGYNFQWAWSSGWACGQSL